MLQTVRITSKGQITIPAKVAKALGLKKGDALLMELNGDKIIMSRQQKILDELAGSIELPKKYQRRSLEFIISDAKQEYFSRKKK